MANINLSGLSEEEKAEYTKKAEASGATSRSEWLRWRLRAGIRLWDENDNFDRTALDRAFYPGDTPPKTSPASPDDSQSAVKEVIEKNVSATEPTSFDEVQNIVVEELVTTALYELQKEERIENVPGKGYRRNWKND